MSAFCLAYAAYPTFVDAAAMEIHVFDIVSHDLTSLRNLGMVRFGSVRFFNIFWRTLNRTIGSVH
jgi:hypothetical protein